MEEPFSREELEIALKVYEKYMVMINNIGYNVVDFRDFLKQKLSKLTTK